MGRHHENMTDKQKAETLDAAVTTFRFLVQSGFQGNITFPVYDRAVGKIKAELFMAPELIPGLMGSGKVKEGGGSGASG